MIERAKNTIHEKAWLHFCLVLILYATIPASIPEASAADASTDRVPYTIVDTAQI
ncbi:MAG: hypothetical protein HQ580_17720, partial [Planctomycetes bacterium]|nr:hypothetical protein [Planctomycetota bacterium]